MAQRKHAELIKQWADDDSLVMQVRLKSGEWFDWTPETWIDEQEYRFKPTKPSIDWDHVADEFVQIATDKNGQSFAFTDGQLIASEDHWKCVETTKFASLNGFKSFKAGTCDWKDSLVMRPEVK